MSGDLGDLGIVVKVAVSEALSGLQHVGGEAKKTEQSFASLGKQQQALSGSFGGIAEAMNREKTMLEAMRKPMADFQRDLTTLDSLRKRDMISAREHAAELGKLRSSAGVGNPMDAVSLKMPEKSPGIMDKVGGFAAGAATLGGVTALVGGLVALDDAYINLQNSAGKFTDSTHSANQIIHEQLDLAGDLHSSLAATMDVYDAVRDGTDELNLRHQKQIDLTRTLGEAVQLSGRSLDQAGGMMAKLSYAMASGEASGGELKKLMTQMPDLANLWTSSFNTTRAGFIKMVTDHKIGMREIIDVTAQGGSVHEEFAKRTETTGSKWQHFKDEFIAGSHRISDMLDEYEKALAAGGFAQQAWNAGIQEGTKYANTFYDTLDNVKQKMAELQVATIALGPMAGTQKLINEGMKAGEFLDGLRTPMERWSKEVEKLERWHEKGTIGAEQYANALGRLQSRMPKGAASPQGLQGAFPWGDPNKPDAISGGRMPDSLNPGEHWMTADSLKAPDFGESWDQTIASIGKAREALIELNKSTADSMKEAAESQKKVYDDWADSTQKQIDKVADGIKPVEDGFVRLFTTGKFGFKEMVDTMITDLTRLAVRQAEMALLNYAFTGSVSSPASQAAAAGGNHAFGGGYTAPWTGGGQDSIPVMFRMSPGEHVQFTPQPTQQAAVSNPTAQAPINLRVSNQIDPRALIDAMGSPDGERVIINVISRNRRGLGLS